MTLKRFITASILAASGLYASACTYEGTHNYYMFSVFNRDYTGENYNIARINQIDFINKINQNWASYTGGTINTYDSAKLRSYTTKKGDQPGRAGERAGESARRRARGRHVGVRV